MLIALRHPVYRRLFTAHIVALVGTGLATIAIGFLAFDIAGDAAAAALGTILTIKMTTFLVISPLAPAIARRIGARRLLIATDLIRAGVALTLPFVDGIAQAYLLVFALQVASALFTPTFQATIPLVLTDRDQYTGALALSRLAYDLETLTSPTLASIILLVAPSSMLFLGTGLGFAASAALIASAVIPRPAEQRPTPFREQVTRGARLMFTTPQLRGILSLHLALAAVGAIVLVLSVPLARGVLGGTESQAAWLLATFGFGAMTAALLMPTIVARVGPRRYMMSGIGVITAAMALLWPVLAALEPAAAVMPIAALWFVAGLGFSAALAPMGRVIRDCTTDDDLPAVFAAQFSLAHGWWLLTYPIAGWIGSTVGIGPVSMVLVAISAVALVVAVRLWPDRAEEGDAAAPGGAGWEKSTEGSTRG